MSEAPMKAPKCSRCRMPIKDFAPADPETGVTHGYYDVREGRGWEEFSKPGEKFVCDDCMHRHPIYFARYGPTPIV
jgi:hypothetical protein